MSESGESPIAIFDLDGTLTYCDSLFPFLRAAVGRKRFVIALCLTLPTLVGFRLGLLGAQKAKEAVLKRFIGGWGLESLLVSSEDFVKGPFKNLLNPDSIRCLEWHASQHHRIAIASASLECYVSQVGAMLGVDKVVASRLEVVDGKVTGRMLGKNCDGREKYRRIAEDFGFVKPEYLYVYGDSPGDQPLLDMAAHAHYRPFRKRLSKFISAYKFGRALL